MMTEKYGLLGKTLGHSFSPQIHALLGDYPYALYEVGENDVERFLSETDLAGMNVTIPYKQTVIPYCVSLSGTACRIGAVNHLTPREFLRDFLTILNLKAEKRQEDSMEDFLYKGTGLETTPSMIGQEDLDDLEEEETLRYEGFTL